MRWATAISTRSRVRLAVTEVLDSIEEQLDGARPDLAFAFVTPQHRAVWDSLPGLLSDRLDGTTIVGCSAGGAIGQGEEVEDRPAVSVAAAVLPGVSIRPFEISADQVPPPAEAAALWHDQLGLDAASHLVLLPDPFSCEVESMLAGLDTAFPGRTVVGGLVSGARRQRQGTQMWIGDRIVEAGAVGVALSGNIVVDSVVAQGCRPIGSPMFLTGCRGNLILEIDGRPPADVLHELFESLSERDQELLRYSLFLGIVMRSDQVEYGPGDFLVRNLLGFDPSSGALAVGAELEQGRVIQFHLRDGATSAADLRRMLDEYQVRGGAAPAGALLFSCLGRGFHLYNEPSHDSRAFLERVGEVPLGGFFCNGEIGPVQGRTYLHGYTSVFALFRSAV